MRKPGDWMQPADERILEVLRAKGNLQPKTITELMTEQATDLEYTSEHVGRRCRALEERGLLSRFGAGVYSITDTGREYLDGELDAGDLD